MYTNRKYTVGDRVFVLVKGNPDPNGPVRQIAYLSSNHFDAARLRQEPLYLIEGYIGSHRQLKDQNGMINAADTQASSVSVLAYQYEELMSEEVLYMEYGLSDAHVDQHLNMLQLAIGKQITTEEQWKFAVRFMYPEVVVEQGYNRLLGDLVQAFNPASAEVAPSDREAVIAQANALGFKVRTMPTCGYRARWPISNTQQTNEAIGRYSWSILQPNPVAPAGG